MPNHSGPNTNESGLVFSFDVNDYNSFKGQPGTNLGSGPNFGYSSSGYTEYQNGKLIRWKSVTEKVHIPTLGVKDVKTIEWYNVYSGYGTDGNYNCCPTIFTYSPNGWNSTILEPSTEYMYQIIYKSASGYTHPNYMYHYERSPDDSQGTEFGVHSTGRRTHLGDGWYHAWGAFTTQSYTVKGYFGCWHYEYNTKNKVSLAAVSLVKGNTVRPPAQFIDEGVTLGNTEALLDLTGNATIDLSNVSFDADAQITFDGTNDYIDGPALSTVSSEWTVEVIFKPSSVTNYENVLDCNYAYNGTTGNIGPRLEMNNSGTLEWIWSGDTANNNNFYRTAVKGSGLAANTWHYAAISRTSANTIIGICDDEVTTGITTSGTPTAGFVNEFTNLNFGRGFHLGGAERVFTGDIAYVKVYDRALSRSELEANYNAVKSRFNI